ncbi:hypothetical protein EAO82_15225 [Halopseudomonas pelagia]|uniref:DUF6957 domain-containing protein n=2 Tax=Halopseudomonas pelagia TaxID=553151 RepID=A0AA91U687_9GAMM|nr:hypothetical protein CO192_01420 [Halopseudomonas pelagia]QFY57601.1 hypothetical protein EAO82_15225 [Halopseudomonas pelagia]
MSQLLYGPGVAMPGSSMTKEDALLYMRERQDLRPYCIVRDWIWVDLDLNQQQLNVLESTGKQPAIIYAHTVLFDSEKRLDIGDFVRTSPLVAFEDGYLFATANTTYVLLGNGVRKLAKVEMVGRIF